jgi:uncharacterized RDD family membrane protein YckC
MVATATPRVAVHYAGIVTRGVALAIDAAIANAIVLLTAALVALVSSMVGELRPQWLVAALAAIGWILVLVAYFSLFWTTTGQTPGMRLMELRVLTTQGESLHLGRSLLRVAGLALAIIPLFAGFLPVLFDARRRGVHDMLARTVVVHAR